MAGSRAQTNTNIEALPVSSALSSQLGKRTLQRAPVLELAVALQIGLLLQQIPHIRASDTIKVRC